MTAPHRPVTTIDDVHPAPAPLPDVRAELERLRELSESIAAAAAQIDAQRRTIERLLAAATPPATPAPPPAAPAHPGALRGPIRARRRAHPAHAVEHVTASVEHVTASVEHVTASVARVAEPAARTEGVADSEAALATARLVALSMAASGSSRSEVARHLRSERGINDTARVTDYVFGRPEPS